MKKWLWICFCLVGFQIFAGCPACVKRRAQMMAKRPTLEAILPKHIEKAIVIDRVKENFENGHYDTFFENLHHDFLKAYKKQEFKNFLNMPRTGRPVHSYFGQSVIDIFSNYPKKIHAVKCIRSENLKNLRAAHPGSYLDSVLAFLSKNLVTDDLMESLKVLSNNEKFKAINQEFWLSNYLYNMQALRSGKTKPDDIALHCLSLDFERLHQMEKVCDDASLLHIANVRAALPNFAKFLHWEAFLRNVAADCFKLPGDIDEKLAEIQKDYMQQRAECIRKNRELITYR